jgi:hypothetical protein
MPDGHGASPRPKHPTPGAQQAAERLERCEVRSFEAEYADALWHLDFHHARQPVLTPAGQWIKPLALRVLDDHSRRACHLESRTFLRQGELTYREKTATTLSARPARRLAALQLVGVEQLFRLVFKRLRRFTGPTVRFHLASHHAGRTLRAVQLRFLG